MVKIRDTASKHLDAPKEQVLELLRDPDTLSLVSPEGTDMTQVAPDEVEVRGNLEGVHVDERCRVKVEGDRRVDLEPIVTHGGSTGSWFIAEEEGDGTRVIHGRWVEPDGLMEEISARLNRRDLHDDLEESLDTLESLVGAVDTAEI